MPVPPEGPGGNHCVIADLGFNDLSFQASANFSNRLFSLQEYLLSLK
jgi:hypothetical protein